MFGATWVYTSTFSTIEFMKSKYRSRISNEKLVSIIDIYCVIYTQCFEDLGTKSCISIIFMLITCLNGIILDI